MFRRISSLAIFFLCCLFAVNNVQSMQQQEPKKIVILHDRHSFDAGALHALQNFILQINASVEIVMLDFASTTPQQVRENLNNCYAVLYCQSPTEVIGEAMMVLITGNGESLRDNNGIMLHGIPIRDENASAQLVNAAVQGFNATAARLRELLNNFPDDRKAFVNLWRRNEVEMGDALRGGRAVELCPITAAMGNHSLDLWYRTEELIVDQDKIDAINQNRKPGGSFFGFGWRNIQPQIFGSLDPNDNGILTPLCQDFSVWLRHALTAQAIVQPLRDPLIHLPKLVCPVRPALQIAGERQSSVFESVCREVRQVFWPRVDLPTLDMERQIRPDNLIDAIKTEVDTHLIGFRMVASSTQQRLIWLPMFTTFATFGGLLALFRGRQVLGTALAGFISGLATWYGCKCSDNRHRSIFNNHVIAIRQTALVNQQTANLLKARYPENDVNKDSADRLIGAMAAE